MTTTEEITKELQKEKERLEERSAHIDRENNIYCELKRKSRLPRPVVVLCGSCRLEERYRQVAAEFSGMGALIFDPEIWGKWEELHADDGKDAKMELDALHFAKIRMSNIVYVLDDGEGESTSREVRYAQELLRPVYYYDRMKPSVVMDRWLSGRGTVECS